MSEDATNDHWIGLLEATGPDVSLDALEEALVHLASHAPTALVDPGRCAIQLHVVAPTPEAALALGLSWWRSARATAGTTWRLVRAELISPEEFADDWQRQRETVLRITNRDAVEAAYGATRRLLWIGGAHDAAAVLGDLAHRLGGSLVPARHAHPFALPLDLSFGVMEPVTPVAPPGSPVRRHLEEALPVVADDAWRVLRLKAGECCTWREARMRPSDN